MIKKQFYYGKYIYEYKLKRENRKTLSLTVKPDMNIVLKAPFQVDNKRIEVFLKRKWLWLEKQLGFFKKYQRKIYKKEFISGENFFYLGRQYKLKVVRGKESSVLLKKGKLKLTTTQKAVNASHNKKILSKWYEKRTKIIFNKRYFIVLNKFEYDFVPQLIIRKMIKRWGSFLSTKKIILNPKLIKAPTDCIDYVITHELCHFRYKNHSKLFYNYLSKQCPNWKIIKEKLELKLG